MTEIKERLFTDLLELEAQNKSAYRFMICTIYVIMHIPNDEELQPIPSLCGLPRNEYKRMIKLGRRLQAIPTKADPQVVDLTIKYIREYLMRRPAGAA